MEGKKAINVNFCDFWPTFIKTNNLIYSILSQKYEVIISDNPDYIFYSVFSDDYLKFNCVRIFITGEFVHANFNLCDYAISNDWMTLEDRAFHLPFYLFGDSPAPNFDHQFKIAQERCDAIDKMKAKTDFCSFVYSNANAMPERARLFELLSAYKTIKSGGKYLNNVDGPVADKLTFQQSCKFAIAVENTIGYGYTSEKIIEAFAAGGVPIYFGNPAIAREFNAKAFVNVHDYDTLEEAVQRVIELDQNDLMYLKVLEQPIFAEGFDPEDILKCLKDFLYHIVDQPLQLAKRRSGQVWSLFCEKREQYCAHKYQNRQKWWHLGSQCYSAIVKQSKTASKLLDPIQRLIKRKFSLKY